MKQAKKILSLILIVVMLLSIIPMTVSAETYTYGDFTYELTDSYYGDYLAIITSYGGTDDSVTIPSKINGYDVAMIYEDAFQGNQNIVEIVIPSTVIYIDEQAFESCSSLKSVVIEGDDTYILTYAFRNCTALKNITINGKSVHVGGFAFYNTAFWNDESNWENGLLYLDNYLIAADPTVVKGKLEVSEGTLGIAGGAFQDCVFLTEIIIPEGTTIIGEGSFAYCVALEKVSLASTVSYIDYAAFEGCASLKSINIPKATVYIGQDAFSSCFSLESIEIQNSIAVLEEKSIGYTYYTVSDFDRYIEIMQEGLIKSSNGEDTTELEEELSSLINLCTEYKEGFSVFTCRFGSYSFENAVVTDKIMGVPEIKGINGSTVQIYAEENGLDFNVISTEEAFSFDFEYTFNWTYNGIIIMGYTGNETNVIIPEEIEGVEVEGIAEEAFSTENTENNINIKSIEIPDNISRIGAGAFMMCLNLETVNIPDGITSIDHSTFAYCLSLKEMKIPDNISSIGAGAFMMCLSLETVNIPDSIMQIGDSAFSYCFSIENIEIPDGVKTIGETAYYNCLSLEKICIYSKDIQIGEMAIGYTEATIDETIIERKEFIEKYCQALKYEFNGQSEETDVIYAEIQNGLIMYDEPQVKDSATIYGYTDSTAHTYADENIISFIPLDGVCKHENTEIINVKTATCEANGYEGDIYCNDCKTIVENGTVVEKTAHTEEYDKKVMASCTETGLTEGSHCSVCGEIIVAQEVVSALGHSIVKVDAQAKTCSTIGWDAYEYCTECDYTTYREITAGHEIKTVGKKDATCKEKGYEAYEYCTACYYITYKEIPVIDHIDNNGDYKCDYGCGHEFEKPAEPETPDAPDKPDTPTDESCDHLCHKSGFMGFIWKIIRFFIKLFKTNAVCYCGAAHY